MEGELMRRYIFILALALFSISPRFAQAEPLIDIDVDSISVKGVRSEVKLVATKAVTEEISYRLTLGEEIIDGKLTPGQSKKITWKPNRAGRTTLVLDVNGKKATEHIRVIPGILTILPPLLAIGLALATRQVLVSLFLSIWLGALFVYNYNPLGALWRTADTYILGSLADPGNAAMLLFIIFIGGCIGVVSKSGGMQGVVNVLRSYATTPRRAQFLTWFLGLFIFFDDYANTIIVGNTMRPISDDRRISREKLAYIVDSTSAPVASIALISTWIGLEVGLINEAFDIIGMEKNGYVVFIRSIPYRFYPLLALTLGFMTTWFDRDFGPMLKAERRARSTGKVIADGSMPLGNLREDLIEPPEGAPCRWYNALAPILVVVIATFIGLWYHGKGTMGAEQFANAAAWEVFSSADANIVLCWSSLLGGIVAISMVVFQRILTLSKSMDAWLGGVQSMVIAIIILLLAWSLGTICKELHTAEYLTTVLMGRIEPHFLPVIVFALSAVISFATGTSYGTMGILIPLVVSVTLRLSTGVGIGGETLDLLLVGVVSSVLAGSIFGVHCSPISDTTIMSSMASSSDHTDHVRTQLPYALLVAGVGMAVGDIPTAYGMPPWVSLVAGVGILAGFLWIFAKSDKVLD